MKDYRKYSKKPTIHIIQSGLDEFIIRFRSSDPDIFHWMVEGLKNLVPPDRREYFPRVKNWRVFDGGSLNQYLIFAKGFKAEISWAYEDAPRSRNMSISFEVGEGVGL